MILKFPVKSRDILLLLISVFGFENKEKYSTMNTKNYVSIKCCEEKDVHLLSIGEECKGTCFLIKDFNIFMSYQRLHCGRKFFVIFYCYCLQAFSTEGILKRHIKDYFRIDTKMKKTKVSEAAI